MKKKILGGIGSALALFCASSAAQDDGGAWISGGKSWAAGASGGHGWYGRVMATPTGKGAFVLSHTHLIFEDYSTAPNNNDSASVKETNLELGFLPAAHGAIFFGLGVSRVQFDGPFCPTNERQVNCVGAGFVGEAVFALPWAVGLEVRAFGDVNPFNNFMGLGVGLRFGGGGSRSDNVSASQTIIEVLPTPPPAASPPPPRPAGAEPAPGKVAKIRPEAQARAQPKTGTNGTIPAGATVTLKSSVTNNEGTWWYVEANGRSGWARAEDLDVAP